MESTGLVDGYVLHELLRAAGEDGRAAGPSESGSPAKEYVLEIQGRHNSSGAYILWVKQALEPLLLGRHQSMHSMDKHPTLVPLQHLSLACL